MRSKLVVGNWKMNGSLVRNQALLTELSGRVASGVDVAVCVPFPYLQQAQGLLGGSSLRLGAQNASEFGEGAFTGEVSAPMLREFGCRYVIVGHSERRTLLAEDDAMIVRKAQAVLAADMMPIVCIGESLEERDAGEVEVVLRRQLDAFEGVVARRALASMVFAYEPVWAIGTGRSASPEQVQEVLSFIRRWLSDRVDEAACVRILYGGSVKGESAPALFGLPDCDGGLIGGASLVAGDFLAICEAARLASHNDLIRE